MTKEIFFKTFYKTLQNDVVLACDELFRVLKRDELDSDLMDKYYYDVAKNFVLRIDRFDNFLVCCDFLCRCVKNYPRLSVIWDFNPKISPCFLPMLLTFNYIYNECKKND